MANQRIILRPDGPRGPAIEFFVSTSPAYTGRPAILFVHGHQEQMRIGGRDMVESGSLERIAVRDGVVAASVSQPGYGGSDGPPDWCGPATQRAIRNVLACLRRRADVDPGRLVLFGVSRGAIASSMVATEEPELRALILVGGLYDLASAYPDLLVGIRRNVGVEAGTTLEAFEARSALPIADRILASTLILHGRYDDRCPSAQAAALAATLRGFGRDISLALFDSGHLISSQERQRYIVPFLARVTQTQDQ